MTRIIDKSEVRKGDRIRITRVIEGEVTHVIESNYGNSPTYKVDGRNRELRDVDGMVNTIELLDRPVLLPTKSGSVIRVKKGADDSAIWMLNSTREMGMYPVWTSETGFNARPAEMASIIRNGDFEVEVLL